jgi:hypothetical protein
MHQSRRKLILFPWTFLVFSAVLILLSSTRALPQSPSGDHQVNQSPVVLELFTSQGCSSCPPADALISELGFSTKNIIALAYHVDYWNRLGWIDRLSSPDFSDRQTEYGQRMNLGGDYTPQMVIEGHFQCVGSDRGSVARAIAAARHLPLTSKVTLKEVRYLPQNGDLRVEIDARTSSQSQGPAPTMALMVAVFENGIVTNIGSGENGGREITYDFTVRKLQEAAEISASQTSTFQKEIRIALDPAWPRDHIGVAAFIQDPVSLRIGGAASKYPIEKN